MKELEKLLQIKATKKKKNPDFVRQDYNKKKKLKKTWRRPKGLQSKLRMQLKGSGFIVKPGYRKPAKVRGLTLDGFEQVKINTLKELENINPKTQKVIFSSNIGFKKKKILLEYCLKNNIVVINVKNPEKYIEQKTEQLNIKKKEQQEKKKLREEKKSEKKEKKKSVEEKLTEEEKKEAQKKEMQKIVTKKET